MRIAIAHDIFTHFGGAERVLLSLADMFPDADVIIPLIHPHFVPLFKSRKLITSSFLTAIPYSTKKPSLLKPFFLLYWQTHFFDEYDLIISSSHSFSAKSIRHSAKTKHISYIHTPPKFLYHEFNETQWLSSPGISLLLGPLLNLWRFLDYQNAQKPDLLLANSQTVQTRIKKYYGRNSTIVYPPITIPSVIQSRTPQYFLFFSRLVKQKGAELAIRTCNHFKLPLVVVGSGTEETYLKRIAGPTIRFTGFVPQNHLAKLFSHTIALLYPNIDEDFGMAAVEAMAHGIPVIGYKSGGIRETVIPGKSGLLFDTWSVYSLGSAIKKLLKNPISSQQCRQIALGFSEKMFKSQIQLQIKKIMQT